MPPQYVRPYVKRNKNDATDAEAICEAVTRPTMRFVPIKSIDQQAVLMLHRSRDLLIRQRTALVNALRGHFAELGIVVGQGIWNVAKLVEEVPQRAWNVSRQSREPCSRSSRASSVRCNSRSGCSKPSSWPGIVPMPRASDWRPSRVSGRSRRPRSSPPSPAQRSSARRGSSRPGSGWCHASIQAAAKTG
jgi:hypothetical protein